MELGFSAIAALAKAWESAEPEGDAQESNSNKGNKVFLKWKLGCTAVANTFAELLQQAWLLPLQASYFLNPLNYSKEIFFFPSIEDDFDFG